jgi:hypothetical protein
MLHLNPPESKSSSPQMAHQLRHLQYLQLTHSARPQVGTMSAMIENLQEEKATLEAYPPLPPPPALRC